MATFILMRIASIDLHRVSLGALVIALGMLVDNAIVITDGILIGLKQGLTRVQAAHRIVQQTMWPLLGATVISVTAFAPIGLSPDATGEFTGSLFWILLISLMISWVLAITLTPFFAALLFKENVKSKGAKETDETGEASEVDDDPYKGAFYGLYRWSLLLALRLRWVTALVMVLGLASAIYGFTFVNQAFFPPSNLPMFTVDYWLPQGSDIRATIADMDKLEEDLQQNEGIKQITATVGTGAERFMLTYFSERKYPNYGQFIIEVKDYDSLPEVRNWVEKTIKERAPQAFVKSSRFQIGPANKAKIEARISGSDPAVLRALARKVMKIYRADPDTGECAPRLARTHQGVAAPFCRSGSASPGAFQGQYRQGAFDECERHSDCQPQGRLIHSANHHSPTREGAVRGGPAWQRAGLQPGHQQLCQH